MLSGKSINAQILARWREFVREPSTIFWVIFMPVLWMIGLGYAFSEKKSERYSIGMAPPPAPTVLADLVEHQLKTNSQIEPHFYSSDELFNRMKRGQIALIIEPTTALVRYHFDPHNPEALRAQGFVNDLIQAAAGRRDPILTENKAIAVQGGRYIDFLLPGILAMSIMSSSLFGVGMSIVSDRREKLLKRYLVTPLRAEEYVLSHIVGRFVIFAIEFVTIMLCGYLIFHFKVYGSFLAYFLISLLGAASFTAIALLCAARPHSMNVISGIINLITIPNTILAGVFFSKTNLPGWLMSIVDYLPLTAMVDALRKIALEGQPITSLYFESAVLLFYLIVSTVLAAKTFKWR